MVKQFNLADQLQEQPDRPQVQQKAPQLD